jgi:hypothetical protein
MTTKSLPKKLAPQTLAVPTAAPVAIGEIVSAISECVQTHQRERTRREEIEADKQIALARIERQHDLLDTYVHGRMGERASLQSNVFRTVDVALEKGNDEALDRVLRVLESELCRNPLSEFVRLCVPEGETT